MFARSAPRGAPDTDPRLRVADLEMDGVAGMSTRAGQPLELTAREFDLLEYLVRRRGHVVSREMVTREVWKEPDRHTPLDNVIDVHVARLRRKVDDQFPLKLLHTVRGVGFVVREEKVSAAFPPAEVVPAEARKRADQAGLRAEIRSRKRLPVIVHVVRVGLLDLGIHRKPLPQDPNSASIREKHQSAVYRPAPWL